MHFNVITLFPESFESLKQGITGRALTRELVTLTHWNPRDYTPDKTHQRVDDRPYGGGPGMLMHYPALKATWSAIQEATDKATGPLIYLSPQGKPLTQDAVNHFATLQNLTLLCGRYEGIDERFIEKYVDESWSVGDYVLSGGEIPAMLLIDAITRQLPGALGDPQSAEQDSFSDGLLDCPHYTRPEIIDGMAVPPVLLSGDHQAIAHWRQRESLIRTWQKRPDLIKRRVLTSAERQILKAEGLADKLD